MVTGLSNTMPCGENSYATFQPAFAVIVIRVGAESAPAGKTILAPDAQRLISPPCGPMTADALTSIGKLKLRLRAMTVAMPGSTSRRPDSAALADSLAPLEADGANVESE